MLSRNKWLIVFASVVTLSVLSYSLARFFAAGRRAEDIYAVEYAAEVIIECMKHNGNSWPAGWEELAPYAVRWPIDDLRGRIQIDFEFMPSDLMDASPPVRIAYLKSAVQQRSGRREYFEGRNPYAKLYEYLESTMWRSPRTTTPAT